MPPRVPPPKTATPPKTLEPKAQPRALRLPKIIHLKSQAPKAPLQEPPRTPAELAGRRCIRLRLPGGALYRWEFQKDGETLTLDVEGPLTLDDMPAMRAAARDGIGLAYMSEVFVRADIASGRLQRVLTDWTPPFPGIALYYPSRRHAPAGLRAFVELIREMNGA